MKKLITLRGNSGSGKTTIARALQDRKSSAKTPCYCPKMSSAATS